MQACIYDRVGHQRRVLDCASCSDFSFPSACWSCVARTQLDDTVREARGPLAEAMAEAVRTTAYRARQHTMSAILLIPLLSPSPPGPTEPCPPKMLQPVGPTQYTRPTPEKSLRNVC